MALVLNDRVKETSTTQGTGDITLAGAVNGFQTFQAGVGNSNTTYYSIYEQGTNNWEVGLGTLNASSTTLARTPISSSNSNNLVNFNAGGTSSLDVFCTLPASKTTDMIMSVTGDTLYASSANTPAKLALGTAGQILTVNSGATAPEWTDPAAAGASEGFAVAMAIAL
jgi:hypothetical protein